MPMKKLVLFTTLIAMLVVPAISSAATPYDDQTVSSSQSVSSSAGKGAPTVSVDPDRDKAAAFNKGRKTGLFYKPTGRWTGRLTLPGPEQRLPDGSVFIRLSSAPDSSLINKTFRLVRIVTDPADSWVETMRPDVQIDEKKMAAALKKGDRIPVKLNGLKRVSVLESLAAARPGEMEVVIPDPSVQGDRLLIDEDPIQISGSRKALVQFVGPAMGRYRKVRHYNQASGAFDGEEEYVSIPSKYFRKADDVIPMTCTDGIENSESNTDGWFLYGFHASGFFNVEALEPRRALSVAPDASRSGSEDIISFLAEGNLTELRPDLTRRMTWLPSSASNVTWPVGTRGLVTHLFGWRRAPNEKSSGVILGLVTGHFAFGQAKVVKCPFTGEPRWDIDYFQIYVHNPNGIVSCTQKWHAYMGNLRRGWMFTVPVSDTIVVLPDQVKGEINGRPYDLYRGLRREFEKMMALYRTGSGTGLTAVRTDVSCVQDSHAALYGAIKTFEQLQKPLRDGTASGQSSRAASALEKISKLVQDIERNITFHGIPSGKWKAFFEKPEAERNANIATILWDSMLSAGTIFPRNANDKMIEMLATNQLPMWNILVCQIGGKIPGLEPLAATSPRRH